jgi:hypothetical protein
MQGKIATHPIPHEIVGFLADEARRQVTLSIIFPIFLTLAQTLIPDLFDALHKKGKKIAVFGEMLNHKEGLHLFIYLSHPHFILS